MEYEINNYFQYTIFKNNSDVSFTNGSLFFKLKKEEWKIIKKEHDLNELAKKIKPEVLNLIISTGYILKKDYFDKNRYLRTNVYNFTHKIFTQTELNKNILVLGAGGTGTWIVYLLKNSGFKNITVVDFDVIEETNLNRQIIYTKNDIGKKKIDVLNNYFDGELNVIDKKITSEIELLNIYKNYDYVFKCIDSPFQIHRWFDSVSKKTNIPYFSWMLNGQKISNTTTFKIKQDDNGVLEVGGTGSSHPYLILNCVLNMYDEFQSMLRFNYCEKETTIEIWKKKNSWITGEFYKYFLLFFCSLFVPVIYVYLVNVFIQKDKLNVINGAILRVCIIVCVNRF